MTNEEIIAVLDAAADYEHGAAFVEDFGCRLASRVPHLGLVTCYYRKNDMFAFYVRYR
jgi:hypothetical protein